MALPTVTQQPRIPEANQPVVSKEGYATTPWFRYWELIASQLKLIVVGAVAGPATSTQDAIARWDNTTGTLLADSVITIADGATPGSLSGTNTGDVTLAGTPDYITISGQVITRHQVDLTTDVTGALPIANGGTGQTSKTPAFDALAPTTTKGDLIAHDGSDNVRVAVGANNKVLTADSTAAAGVSWQANPAASSWIPLVDGSEPPVFITDGAGTLIVVAYS